MQANVLFFQLHPDTDKDEALREFRDEVLPEVEQLPGHKNGLLLANWAIGKVILIILWETEAHEKDARDKGHHDRLIGKTIRHLSAPPLWEDYEVAFLDLEPSKATGYARVIYSQIKPGPDYDEVIKIFRDEATPADKQQPGYKGNLALGNRVLGKGITVALWETEAETHASEHSGHYQRQAHKFAHLFKAPLVRELFEVVAHNLR